MLMLLITWVQLDVICVCARVCVLGITWLQLSLTKILVFKAVWDLITKKKDQAGWAGLSLMEPKYSFKVIIIENTWKCWHILMKDSTTLLTIVSISINQLKLLRMEVNPINAYCWFYSYDLTRWHFLTFTGCSKVWLQRELLEQVIGSHRCSSDPLGRLMMMLNLLSCS